MLPSAGETCKLEPPIASPYGRGSVTGFQLRAQLGSNSQLCVPNLEGTLVGTRTDIISVPLTEVTFTAHAEFAGPRSVESNTAWADLRLGEEDNHPAN